MNQRKKALIFIIVGLLILSLILFYFPFALSRPALEKLEKEKVQNQTQAEIEPNTQPSTDKTNQASPTSSIDEKSNDSFFGLEEEVKSFDEFENVLENF